MNSLKTRLAALSFLEFAVWGSYLISMGQYLFNVGLVTHIGWFYTVQGIVSLFMPGIIGAVADRYVPAQRMLAICHFIAALAMATCGLYCAHAGAQVQFSTLFTFYTISVAFFMPTIGLSNSVSFNALTRANLDTNVHFPPIRVWGTVGFIAASWIVNFIHIDGVSIQETYHQFYQCAIFGIVLSLYSLTMPHCEVNRSKRFSLSEALALPAFKLFRRKEMAIFLIFSMLLGVSLQITNGFGSTFIKFFGETGLPEFKNFFSNNPTLLISLSQCAEALCILLIPFCMRRFGIKGVMFIAMVAWVLRFGLFGIGDTNFPGVLALIGSCIVYGVAFDFFNVSGGMYIDKQVVPEMRSQAQGLFMIMTNGIGASVGTFLASKYVINKFVNYFPNDHVFTQADRLAQINGWHTSWLIFAAYAAIVAVLFYFCFNAKTQNTK